MRVMWRIGLASALLFALGCPKPPPQTALEERSAEVHSILAGASDAQQISSAVGALPERCVQITLTTRICQWRLGNRNAGWLRLARALGTRDPVNVLCELPSDGSPRERQSCEAFPRRSNRTLFQIPTNQRSRSVQRRASEKHAKRAEFRRIANERLDAAGNAVELTNLMGEAPDHCEAVAENRFFCVWRAGAQTYGHGTLVESVGAEKRQRMRLECELPADGERRAPSSCRVQVGA